MDAIALISGGMDSAVIAGIVVRKHQDPLFLHFNYGQRTEQKELESFHNVCHYYHVEHKLVLSIDFFKQLGHSSLVDQKMEIPINHLHSDKTEIPNTYVPFRNGIFLAYATALAEAHQLSAIYIGVVEVDSSGYPDCRKRFYDYFNQALQVGTVQSDIQIYTPLISQSKTEIIRMGNELQVPFQLTWSCYQMDDQACGICDSCLLRLKAFRESGLKDPIPYR